jgi:hypothetical protein
MGQPWFIFLLVISTAAALPVLCRQLQSRHIAQGQAFQLPLEDDGVERGVEVYDLIQRLMNEPFNMTIRTTSLGWFEVDLPQPYTQSELERAFRCSIDE